MVYQLVYINKSEMSWPSVTHRNSSLFHKIASWCVTVDETVTVNACCGEVGAYTCVNLNRHACAHEKTFV